MRVKLVIAKVVKPVPDVIVRILYADGHSITWTVHPFYLGAFVSNYASDGERVLVTGFTR